MDFDGGIDVFPEDQVQIGDLAILLQAYLTSSDYSTASTQDGYDFFSDFSEWHTENPNPPADDDLDGLWDDLPDGIDPPVTMDDFVQLTPGMLDGDSLGGDVYGIDLSSPSTMERVWGWISSFFGGGGSSEGCVYPDPHMGGY